MRWFSLRTRNDILLAIAIVVAWLPLSTDSYGLAGVFADQQLPAVSCYRARGKNRLCFTLGSHGSADEPP
jgi:hypothetical protein